MLEALKTNTKLQKRLGVGAGIFFVAWAIAHIAVAVIAACFLTGLAIYNDKQEELQAQRAAGDLDQIDALARELATKKAKHKREKQQHQKEQQQQQAATRSGGKGKHQGSKGTKGGSHKKAEDPNLACLVKGHVHGISSIAISDDAKLLATASSDAIRVFDAPGLLAKPAAYTYHRIALGGDLASSLSISNCGAYIIYSGRASREVHIWEFRPFTKDHKVGRKPEEMMAFPTDHTTIIDFALFVTSGARPFIVTASADQSDTSVRLWTKKGKSLTRFDTRRAKINAVSVSAEGKFIAVASWTSQVALYEVCRDKDHVFQKVTPAMVFKGHAGQVLDVCFGSFPNGFHNAVSCSVRGSGESPVFCLPRAMKIENCSGTLVFICKN